MVYTMGDKNIITINTEKTLINTFFMVSPTRTFSFYAFVLISILKTAV